MVAAPDVVDIVVVVVLAVVCSWLLSLLLVPSQGKPSQCMDISRAGNCWAMHS